MAASRGWNAYSVTPANAGVQPSDGLSTSWIPAFAGMTSNAHRMASKARWMMSYGGAGSRRSPG